MPTPIDPTKSFTFELDEHGALRITDPAIAKEFMEWLKPRETFSLTVVYPPPNQVILCGEKPILNLRGCPNDECPYEIPVRMDPAIDPVRELPSGGG